MWDVLGVRCVWVWVCRGKGLSRDVGHFGLAKYPKIPLSPHQNLFVLNYIGSFMERLDIHLVKQLYHLLKKWMPMMIEDPLHFCQTNEQLLDGFHKNFDFCFEDSVFLSIYLDRLDQHMDQTAVEFLTQDNIYYVFLAMIIIHCKLHNDIFFENCFYANLAQCDVIQVNAMELFLFKYVRDWFIDIQTCHDKITQLGLLHHNKQPRCSPSFHVQLPTELPSPVPVPVSAPTIDLTNM